MSALVYTLLGLITIGFGGRVNAQDIDLTRAKTAYETQCHKCHGIIEGEARGPERLSRVHIASNDMRFAVALPYGPSLRGIYGRTAGTAPNFAYSSAFKRVFQGMTWNHDTLDRWITDSQQWARGARMFYRQPDPEVRRLIIAYLKTHSP